MLGIAFAGLGKFETSNGHFERAIAINPNGVGGYFYWARELLKRGRTVESEAVMGMARRNVQKIVNYPEVAALYFWLPDSAQGTLQKRTKTLPELKPPGYVRREL
jgi:tetratricopeptide (TPR) repeat protein